MRDDDGNPCETESPSCRLRFGDTDEACVDKDETGADMPFEFSHVYSCKDATSPGWDGSQCVFKPKVQVLDNWGWCNGDCASGGGEGCYEGDPDLSLNPPSECSANERRRLDEGINPYSEYESYIVITP